MLGEDDVERSQDDDQTKSRRTHEHLVNSDQTIEDEWDTCRHRGEGVAAMRLQLVWRFRPQN